jgi:hypothetical protein
MLLSVIFTFKIMLCDNVTFCLCTVNFKYLAEVLIIL